jgi:pimeloyl-ACP methyl ester carboxylesterase
MSMTSHAKAGDDAIVSFTYRADDDGLADLRQRLGNARWPEKETGTAWEQGPPLSKLQRLVGYWRTDYDWRRCESELNRWPQFKTTIDGLGIHYIHVRSPHPNALPVILTHGWPSTVLLFRDVIGPLTNPTEHGGAAADAFDVIIPSLPGFGFSDKPAGRGWNAVRTARAWTILMQRLGYTRYVAQGGDWGAYVTTAMAQQRPAGLAAIHLNFAQTMPDDVPTDLLPDQKRVVEAMQAWREKTRPILTCRRRGRSSQATCYPTPLSRKLLGSMTFSTLAPAIRVILKPYYPATRSSTRLRCIGSRTAPPHQRASISSRAKSSASTIIRGLSTCP